VRIQLLLVKSPPTSALAVGRGRLAIELAMKKVQLGECGGKGNGGCVEQRNGIDVRNHGLSA